MPDPVPSLAEAPLPLPPVEFDEIRGHPLNKWTRADNLEELHAIWVERFTLGSLRDLNVRALWPYADAVELDGNSWGIDPESTTLFYINAGGHAYRRPGAKHPVKGDGIVPAAISLESLAAAGWSALKEGKPLLRTESGPGFRVSAPIHAVTSCLECHHFESGSVVAMLVYSFEEIADD